jgi:broad specificity phosphatase PhoE
MLIFGSGIRQRNMAKLRNRYFAMRHGQSLANERRLIISHPENGVLQKYGLSETGRRQAAVAAENSGFSRDVRIYSSDFSRALQTAEIVRSEVGAGGVVVTALLRERYFGDWEQTSSANYEKVWQFDRRTQDRHENNVEPLASVWARTRRLIAAIERSYQNQDILLVSHGDTLQILQAGLGGYGLSQHRELLQLETAEIRRLI